MLEWESSEACRENFARYIFIVDDNDTFFGYIRDRRQDRSSFSFARDMLFVLVYCLWVGFRLGMEMGMGMGI
jgi:hypothetical protein